MYKQLRRDGQYAMIRPLPPMPSLEPWKVSMMRLSWVRMMQTRTILRVPYFRTNAGDQSNSVFMSLETGSITCMTDSFWKYRSSTAKALSLLKSLVPDISPLECSTLAHPTVSKVAGTTTSLFLSRMPSAMRKQKSETGWGML